MFGSVALDVVIGLVFIFLLYSLFATIINEFIATILGLRARNLHEAIWRMLENDQTEEGQDTLQNKQKKIPKIFRRKDGMLLDKFYDQPTIKYLAANKLFSQPSYINPSDFSKTILDLLKKYGSGSNDLERIKDILVNPSERMDRVKAVSKIINENAAMDDVQKIEEIKKVVEQKEKKTLLVQGETREHIKSLLNDAQEDLVKFKVLLEEWFDNTMDRAVGWYKRQTQFILLLIGFFLAALFNVNTIQIVSKLSKDKDAREQLVQMATSYVESNPNIIQNIDSISKIDTTFKAKFDTLLDVKRNLEKDLDDAHALLGSPTPPDSLQVKKIKISELNESEIVLYKKKQAYIVISAQDKISKKDSRFYKIRKKDEGEITYAHFSSWKYFWGNFFGYLITALAISLGAPFWFDILNKLVKLRSSVQKQTQDRQVTTTSRDQAVPVTQREG